MVKVLVVEDDKQLSTILRDKLTKEGFSITTCGNGKEALEKVATEEFNIILLDLIMPVKTGFDFIESYLAENKNPLSIIVLTNLSEDLSKLKVYQKGIIEYLVKADSSLEVIIAKIKEVLNKKPKFFQNHTF